MVKAFCIKFPEKNWKLLQNMQLLNSDFKPDVIAYWILVHVSTSHQQMIETGNGSGLGRLWKGSVQLEHLTSVCEETIKKKCKKHQQVEEQFHMVVYIIIILRNTLSKNKTNRIYLWHTMSR